MEYADLIAILPNLSMQVAILGIISTYIVETSKIVRNSYINKEWDSSVKRLSALLFSGIFAFGSAAVIPDVAPIVSKFVSTFLIAAGSSDLIYPVLKKLSGNSNSSFSSTATQGYTQPGTLGNFVYQENIKEEK
jgi:hypothetical protein